MRPRNRRDRAGGEGATLERVRLNEAVTHTAFGGRRRRVYARLAALSGARPRDRVLDVLPLLRYVRAVRPSGT